MYSGGRSETNRRNNLTCDKWPCSLHSHSLAILRVETAFSAESKSVVNCMQLFAHPVFEAVEGLLASCLPGKWMNPGLPWWVKFSNRTLYCARMRGLWPSYCHSSMVSTRFLSCPSRLESSGSVRLELDHLVASKMLESRGFAQKA